MTTAITNDFIVRAGLVVQGTAVVTSSTGQVGAAQVNGGLAVAKNVIIGNDLWVGGTFNLNGAINSNGQSTFTNILVTGLAQFNGNTITSGTSYVFGSQTVGDDIYALKNVRVGGGLTATQATSLLGGLTVNNGSTLNGGVNLNGVSTFNGQAFFTGTTGITVGTGPVELGGTLTAAGNVLINSNTTAATGAGGSGALKVVGGVYVGDNLIVNSTAWNTGTNTANSLYVKGGAWIDKSLVVSGPTTFNDVVIFNGTTTFVLSTNTVYTDNLLNLHTPPGGVSTPWTFDDGKDIGLIFHYYKGADKTGFLGFANDSGFLEWYNDGDEVGGAFTGSSYGTFKTGEIRLTGSTDASNTITGALQVVGGIGVGLGVYAGGTVSGSTITARNLTQNRLVITGANGQLTDDADLTWNGSLNQIEGRVAFANTATLATRATNLVGGTGGSLPYQSAPDATTFLGIGSNGYVLQSNGSAPYWGPATGVVAGSASTATNIANGEKDQIPYQSAPGSTIFSNGLRFNGTTFTTTNVVVSGTADTLGNATSGALQVAGGVGIAKSLWVGSSATIAGSLYVDGDIFLQGAGLNSVNAQTGTFETVLITGTTSTGLRVTGDTVLSRNLSVNGVATFSNIVSTIGTISAFTSTNASITNLTVSGGTSLQGATIALLTATIANVTTLNVTGQSTLQNVTAAITTVSNLTVTGNETINGNLAVTGVSTFTGKILVNDVTNANATNVGSIVTLGGIGVAKDIVVGGSITIGSTTANTVVPAILSNNVLLSSFTSNVINTTGIKNLDTFNAATYRTARYTVQIVDGSNIHVSEMTVFHDGTNVYLNEYGISTNNGQLGTFDAQLSAGSVTLQFTPTAPTSMVIKVVRLGITT